VPVHFIRKQFRRKLWLKPKSGFPNKPGGPNRQGGQKNSDI